MCGGKGTTVQQTTIPPEVLARYNAVNARAEDVAKQPFQRYGGEFVAPINQQQMAGISGVNQAANMAQPYFNQASGALTNAYGQANPYYGQSLNTVAGGASQANQLYGTALGGISNAVNIGSQYGTDATRFINQAGTSAQPYMNQAGAYVGSGLAAADPLLAQSQKFLEGSTQAINPQEFGQAQINKYMSPYMKNVVEAQQALQQQESAAQRSALNSQAIGAGAFGGDRAGISQANLARQQSLANQATLGNLLQQGYGQAAGMFQQQQGVNLAAEQANRQAQQFGQQAAANLAQQRFGQNLAASQQYGNLGQALFGQNLSQGQALSALGQQLYGQGLGAAQAQAGIAQNQFGMSAQQANLMQQAAQGIFGMGSQYASGLAGLGTGAQAAALQGAQAQIGAGTLQQQTQQAEDTAKYQQFLQERGYDFQVAQFLANIAMGTGALSGSTTTTSGPMGYGSDRRLKKDIKEIGETHDGLPIYSFKYKEGDDQQRIGVMSDDVRQKHPDAVHNVGGIDSVDYEKIANRASEGGGVLPHRARQGFATDGFVQDPTDQVGMASTHRTGEWGPFYSDQSRGASFKALPGAGGIVPQKFVHVSQLKPHSAPPQQQGQRGLNAAASLVDKAAGWDQRLLGKQGVFGEQGPFSKEGTIRKALTAATGSSGQLKAPEGGQSNTKSSVPQPIQNQSNLPSEKASPISYESGRDGYFIPPGPSNNEGGVMPSKDVVDLEKGTDYYPTDDISLGDFAHGGIVPRQGYALRGAANPLDEKALPYQAEQKYGPEDVNEAESGKQIEKLEEDSKGGGKGGKSSTGIGKTIGSIAGGLAGSFFGPAGTMIGSGLGGLAGGAAEGMFSEGGIVPRQHFDEGGPAKEFTMDDYLNSLATIESRHNYEAKGPVTKSGDRAYGKYQVMGSNVPSWTEEHYGERLTPQQFLTNRDAQESVARGQFGKYLNQHGTPEDAASAWFSGRPMARAGNSSDITGTTVPEYINRFRANLGLDPLGNGAPLSDDRKRSVAGAEYVRNGSNGTEYVNGEPVRTGGLEPPTNYRTGKPYEGWGDFLTSRQFIVPALSGIGAFAASPNRYKFGAIAEGLGAAAQSYAAMEKPMVEGETGRGLASTYAETAKKIAEETKGVTAGLYEKKWIPGVGWWVYDKTKPYEIGKQLTDTNMQPIGGASVDVEKIPTSKDSPKPPTPIGTPGASPTTGTPSKPSAPGTEKPTPPVAYEWKPTVNVPDNFTPKEHFNIVNSPEIMSREATIAAAQLKDQRAKAEGAYNQLYRLDEMQHSFDQLPKTGVLTPGAYGTERAEFAKKINTAAAGLGGKPLFNPSDIAAAELLGKDTFRLGQEAARSAGSREAQAIVQASVGATPGIDNTPMAFKRIASGMRQAAQYELDRTAFLDSYNAKFGHINGADELFRKLNPASEYARQAVVSTVDPTDLKDVQDFIAKNKGRPMDQLLAKIAPKLDAEYGKGTTAIILGVH